MLGVALAAVHIAVTSGIPVAYAQAGFSGIGQNAQGNLNLTMASVGQTIALINTFMHVLLLMALSMLEYLMESSFFGDTNMMNALNSIWVLSRNIMNLLFALMLIGVSLYTIITADSKMVSEKFSTFVIAVILVNFSWFMPRVIIDIANVVTSAVYSIPNTLPSVTSCVDFDSNPCTAITDIKILVGLSGSAAAAAQATFCSTGGGICECISGISCMKRQPYSVAVTQVGQASAMLSGMLTSFIKISSLPKVTMSLAAVGGTGSTFTVTMGVLINILMTFFIQTAILFPLLGLVVGLIIRILILWITMAFMPFGFLGYVITGKFGTEVGGFTVDIKKEFINAAFLPALVAIPMSIGFIMLTVISTIPQPSPTFGNMSWAVPLLSGFPNPWSLMWAFAACAIIWVGTFTVLKRSEVTGMFTEKIKGIGQGVFGAAVQLPLLIPLPVGAGSKLAGANIGSILNAPKDLSRAISLGTRSKSIIPGLNAPPGVGGGGNIDASAAAGALAANKTNTENLIKAINDLKSGGDRGNAILNIQTILGNKGKNEADTLKDLKEVAGKANAPKELSDMIKQIQDEIDKKK